MTLTRRSVEPETSHYLRPGRSNSDQSTVVGTVVVVVVDVVELVDEVVDELVVVEVLLDVAPGREVDVDTSVVVGATKRPITKVIDAPLST